MDISSAGPQGVRGAERPILVPTRSCELPVLQSIQAHPGCPAWGDLAWPGEAVWDAGELGTHGHSRAGFRSTSGWGGRSWWWSPGAGNLSDNGRAPCFQPVVRMEVPTVTFHPADASYPSLGCLLSHDPLPPTFLSLCLVKSYLSLEAADAMSLLRPHPIPWARSMLTWDISYSAVVDGVPDSESEDPGSEFWLLHILTGCQAAQNLYTLGFLCRDLGGPSLPRPHQNVATLKCDGGFQSIF